MQGCVPYRFCGAERATASLGCSSLWLSKMTLSMAPFLSRQPTTPLHAVSGVCVAPSACLPMNTTCVVSRRRKMVQLLAEWLAPTVSASARDIPSKHILRQKLHLFSEA